MKYLVRLYDAQIDQVTRCEVEADSVEHARELACARGGVVLTVDRAKAHAPGKRKGGRFSPSDYALFGKELKTLISAGMTVVEAVDTLSVRGDRAGRGQELTALLRDSLHQGLSLSAAIGGLPGVPPVLTAAIQAGERTSNLREALNDYLKFDELVTQLKRKVISAAIYPAIVTSLGVGICLFLLMVVLPNFSRMYQGLRASATGGVALTIGLSEWVSANRWGTSAVVACAIVALAGWVASGHAARFLITLARHIPPIYRRVQDFHLAMMYQTIALLLRGGYPMTQALAVASQSVLAAELRDALTQTLARVEAGGLVSKSLADGGLADEVGRRLLAAAERNGDFHASAEVVARMHAERFEVFVERLTRIVEPVLLMLVALAVGGVVVMMYLPIFDMATRLR